MSHEMPESTPAVLEFCIANSTFGIITAGHRGCQHMLINPVIVMQSCHCYALLDLNIISNASIAGNVSRTTTLLFAEPAEYDCANYTLLFLSRTLLLLRHRRGNNCKNQTSIFPPILSSSMHPVYKVSGLCKHRNMGIGSTTHRCCMSPTKAAMCSDKGLGIHSEMALETPTSSNSKARPVTID